MPQLTANQVNAGVAAGLTLTSPDSDTPIPVCHAPGIVILHQILLALGAGELILVAAKTKEETPATPEPDEGEGEE